MTALPTSMMIFSPHEDPEAIPPGLVRAPPVSHDLHRSASLARALRANFTIDLVGWMTMIDHTPHTMELEGDDIDGELYPHS